MQHYPLLPSLKEKDNAVAALPRTGTWERVDPSNLDNISRSLKVTTADAKYSDIDSIPCMWARPLLFEMALYDTDHPMHECILGEWRGFLAMLALKERKDFPLKTTQIEIPDRDDTSAPEFLRALRKLLPEHTLEASTTWDKLYLILFNGEPIGMTSPTTLLCTAIDYIGCISDVPWFDGQFLCDPTSELHQEERAAVAGWLTKTTKIDLFTASNPNLNQALNDRIEFIKERLNEQILNFTNALLDGTPASDPKFSDTGLDMTQGLFAGMNYPIARKEFFTEKLFVIRRQNAFLESTTLSPRGSGDLKVGGNSVTPILPITKELLDDFSVDELNQRISFEEIPSGIKVDLRLPSPGKGQKADFVISQEYVEKEDGDGTLFKSYEIVEIPDLPVLEIWPNFRMLDWKTYYTYFTTAGEDTFYAEPFLRDNALDPQFFEDKDMRITQTSTFPEVMICKYKTQHSPNYADAGFLLISAPPHLPAGTNTWNVGIDFGTSSTTVYKHAPNDGSISEPVVFSERLLQITDSREQRTLIYDHFLSHQDEKTPFFSLFQENQRNSENKSENQDQLELSYKLKPLLDGRIYFVDDYKLKENVISNLKWSPDPEDRKRTQAFLEQICLQCAAEAAHSGVNQINWHFSYPIAFSQEDKEQFEAICENIRLESMTKTGIQTQPISFDSESIATAQFFAGKFGGFANGAVCIDIGGETSDISIWQDGDLYWQTSIRFAGRHIFLDLIRHKPSFLKNFDVVDEHIQVLKDVAKSNDFYSQADTWIDAWINNSEQSLQEKFAIYGGKIKGTPFVPLIALGISGLFYYIGLILKYLNKDKDFEPTMPNVYIGGNGSRILHWLANGNFGRNSENNRHLKEVILTASGFDPDSLFDLEITPNPKHEAAAGLVDEEPNLESTQGQSGILAGEAFTKNGKDCEWKDLLPAEKLGKGLTPGKNLAQIENFITTFNAGIGNTLSGPITFDRELKHRLTSNLRDDLQNQRTVEPIFILGLKNLLKRKTEQWN